jgi:thioredoxin reductase
LQKVIDETVTKAVLSKEVGFDGMFFYMCYRMSLMARFISKITNHRTDKYGGSAENRIRFPIMLADAIKKRCGKDFLIIAAMSGCESPQGGYTLEDAAEYARLLYGHVDMMYLKGDPGERVSTPSSFVPGRTPFLYMAESMKNKGITTPVAVTGGFLDLDLCEDAIASGKADLLSIGRAWITTPDYGRLAYEGRNEDVVPCLRCNECYGSSYFKPWNSVCPVNPVWGLEHKIDRMISPPQDKKKVAVIGGGPAGMEAALIASQRGHEVTLYEKSGSLGGLIKDYENISFKWTHKDFKDYLIRQIEKARVKVYLNTEADVEMIREGGYDAVITALGGEPKVPDIPGVKGQNVVFAPNVFGKEDSLAKDVVVIGGGQTGVEIGLHLAEEGHNVTVLEMTDMLARDAVPLHYFTSLKAAWEKLPNLKGIVNARCNGITKDGVTYIDAEGKEQSVQAGSVILATGMKAKDDLAVKFYDASDRWFMVGDCKQAGDIQMAMRSAFSAASTL